MREGGLGMRHALRYALSGTILRALLLFQIRMERTPGSDDEHDMHRILYHYPAMHAGAYLFHGNVNTPVAHAIQTLLAAKAFQGT